ncbi:MAG: alpha/beta hydrolase [Gammaproteobacteria bacterium]
MKGLLWSTTRPGRRRAACEARSRRSSGAAALAATFAVCAGCSPFTAVNLASPSGYVAERGIAYGPGERQALDAYRPSTAAGDASLVVFFYGGGWRSGSRQDYEFVASALTAQGFVVVIPDYRLHPEVAFPAFVEDGARAVAWAAENAERLGASGRRLFLAGHSAGAHIAALLALDPRYLEAVMPDPPVIAGFAGLSGPYDFLPLEPGYLQAVFPEQTRGQSQPVDFASADDPPALLVHGKDDTRVLPGNSEHLAAALESAGVPVRLRLYEDTGHAAVVAALAPPLAFLAPTLEDLSAFVRSR